MPAVEPLNELRRSWRAECLRAVPNRLSTARAQCQDELLWALRELEKPADWEDGVSPMFEILTASNFGVVTRMESLLSDPSCTSGWTKPISVFETTDEYVLRFRPGANAAWILTTSAPLGPWYPINDYASYYFAALCWNFPGNKSENVDHDEFATAIRVAKDSIARWQAFWDTDARWQRERPREWLRIHFERLMRFVAVVAKVNELDSSQLNEPNARSSLVVAKAAKSVQDISIALANDAADLELPGEDDNVGRLKRLAEVAAERCPAVLQSELATDEFRASASALSRAITEVLSSPLPAPPVMAERAASPDFRSVRWNGRLYTFTANQAAAVKVFWEAFDNGTPDVCGATVLEAADISSNRIDVVFRDHPAWGEMIVKGDKKGNLRLADSSA